MSGVPHACALSVGLNPRGRPLPTVLVLLEGPGSALPELCVSRRFLLAPGDGTCCVIFCLVSTKPACVPDSAANVAGLSL